MKIISPSLLAADFTNLAKDLEVLNSSGAQWLHLDVMDGVFVPNISFGFDIIKQLRPLSDLYFDAHLMIANPYKYIKNCHDCGCESVTLHLEAFNSNEEVLNAIKEVKSYGMDVGLSIKPNTDVLLLKPYLSHVDLILVMSVEPGFGGQSFMNEVLEKVVLLSQSKDRDNYSFKISIDGGIDEETAKLAVASGVDVLVAGSYLFKGDLHERVGILKNES